MVARQAPKSLTWKNTPGKRCLVSQQTKSYPQLKSRYTGIDFCVVTMAFPAHTPAYRLLDILPILAPTAVALYWIFSSNRYQRPEVCTRMSVHDCALCTPMLRQASPVNTKDNRTFTQKIAHLFCSRCYRKERNRLSADVVSWHVECYALKVAGQPDPALTPTPSVLLCSCGLFLCNSAESCDCNRKV